MISKHKGSSFDSFLEAEGILDQAEAVAIKRVIAFELKKNMANKHLTKTSFANKMKTSRTALDRLLDPENTSITLRTLVKAANVVGKKLKFSFANSG